MGDKTQTNLRLIQGLVERAPDRVLNDLQGALAGPLGGGALTAVREMVESENADRHARDLIFAPLKPLFHVREDQIEQLTFSPVVLSRLWRAAKTALPEASSAAVLARPDEAGASPAWDELCVSCAAALKGRSHPEFQALADLLDADQADGALQLAGCLELAPIARAALARTPEWIQRMTEERAVTVRLTYKDAVAIAEDGGPRLIEILFANLAEPWVILRLICATMARPVDNYISGSELAGFGLRLLDDIDRRLELLRKFDLDGGEEAADEACGHLGFCTAIASEFEQTLQLGKEGPWGARLNRQKAAVAKLVEGWLKKADGVFAAALPTAPVRAGGRTVRTGPKLDAPPDLRAMRRARAMATLMEKARGAAQNGGFNGLRIKVCEEAEHRLNGYVEDLLHAIHEGDEAEVANARLYMEETAWLMGRVRDEAAAQIVRRRAAAA